MHKKRVASWVSAGSLGFGLLGLSSGAAQAQVVTEFSAGITPGAFPSGITAGPDGNLWFTEVFGNRIGRITPLGVVTEFSAGITAGAGLGGITPGPDGNLWFTENNGNRIGRITPLGVVTEFSAGIAAGAQPLPGITAGPDGNLWFTEQSGNRIGRITPLGVVTEFSAGITANGQPNGITAGPDGNLWFTESNGDRIGRITTAGVVTEFSAGITAGAIPFGITAGPDGNLWFTEFNGTRIGRITPLGVVTEFSAGITLGTTLRGITAGPDGNLWFAEFQGNRIGRITTAGVVTEFSAGITAGAQPSGITAGPDGNLWFTESGGNRIGRITTGAPTVLSVAPTSGDAAGGTAIVINGMGFVADATVTIGGVAASGVDVTSPTTADATTPPLTPGTLNDVVLANPGTASGTLADGWFADFTDVAQADIFHDDVEKLVRNGVTAGCGGGAYCRNTVINRSSMAVFLLKALMGSGYVPPPCTGTVFTDVPCTGGPFDPWIEDLAGRSITGGCGGGNYCPGNPVTRGQMAPFLLKTLLGSAYVPPACTGTVFLDVPCTGGIFDPWIEDLSGRNITAGCGGGNYCPASPNTRGQMAVFLVKAFNLP